MKLFSYVVRRDFGFAPNPFHQVCTLATCKPDIRKQAKIGDWVIGTGSANYPRGPDLRGRLVFAMKVNEVLSFDLYWNSPRFIRKRPNLRGSSKLRMGDNIYHSIDGNWVHVDSHHSHVGGVQNSNNIVRDTSKTTNVLVANEFIYFGKEAIQIPQDHDVVKKGPSHRSNFDADEIHKFISWLNGLGVSGFQAVPLKFPL